MNGCLNVGPKLINRQDKNLLISEISIQHKYNKIIVKD